MAIDYKKEWKELQHVYGKYTIQDQRGLPSIPTDLNELMNFQIQRTISKREKLMEEYIKSHMTTDIGKVNSEIYSVRLSLHDCPTGNISVGRLNFDEWCKKKGGK